MNVYIPTGNITDMQGPAPSGFHVPLSTEWEGLKTIMTSLSLTTGNDWKINLHIPFAGYRYFMDGNISYQGSGFFLWTSKKDGSYNSIAILASSGSQTASFGTTSSGSGYSIRPFKDGYVEPDSSWTVIQGTLGSAGIFRDQTNGLISITDGTNGYTIADKNLGATTVYNTGDTLSEANCGKYYQWGNNYGFAWTGTLTTSSTRVDAGNYGPGNYYNSSTFIGASYWDTSYNPNLRGGVTGPLKMNELKNAYIGKVYEYSYDFSNKSISQLQNDGWTIYGNTPSFSSNGMGLTGKPNRLKKSLPTGVLSGATKITLISNWINNGTATRFALSSTVESSSATNICGAYLDSYNNIRRIELASNNYNTTGFTTGTYTIKNTMDLTNKIATLSVTGYQDITHAITDSEISIIKNCLLLYIYSYAEATNYCKDISITIE